MDLFDVMRTTFAGRAFTGETLGDDVLYRILDNARFAPSGGNRQGVRVIAVREQAHRDRLADLSRVGAKRYLGQRIAGESPWNPVTPTRVTPNDPVVTEKKVDSFVAPLRTASVVLVVCLDLRYVAATDQDLDRIGVISGGSVYPLAWNILLAARAEGYAGTFTTMLVAEEPEVVEFLHIPEHWAVAAAIPLGRPVRQLTRLRRKPVEELVTREFFDGAPLTH